MYLCMNKGSRTSMHRSQWAEKIQNQGNCKDKGNKYFLKQFLKQIVTQRIKIPLSEEVLFKKGIPPATV